jgi:hypothetical protein
LVTLDRDDILAALGELVEVLVATGARAHIGVVGGAAIAVCFTRDATTTDVDALYGSAPEVYAAGGETRGGSSPPLALFFAVIGARASS